MTADQTAFMVPMPADLSDGVPLEVRNAALSQLLHDEHLPNMNALVVLAFDTNLRVHELHSALMPVLTGLAPYAEDPSKLLGMLPEPLRAMFGI